MISCLFNNDQIFDFVVCFFDEICKIYLFIVCLFKLNLNKSLWKGIYISLLKSVRKYHIMANLIAVHIIWYINRYKTKHRYTAIVVIIDFTCLQAVCYSLLKNIYSKENIKWILERHEWAEWAIQTTCINNITGRTQTFTRLAGNDVQLQ